MLVSVSKIGVKIVWRTRIGRFSLCAFSTCAPRLIRAAAPHVRTADLSFLGEGTDGLSFVSGVRERGLPVGNLIGLRFSIITGVIVARALRVCAVGAERVTREGPDGGRR